MPSPEINALWAALPLTERTLLQPELRARTFGRGEILIKAGDPVTTVFLPIDTQLADVVLLDDGKSAAVASIGRQSAAGLAGLLSNEPSAWNVETHIEGVGFGLSASALRRRSEANPSVMTLLAKANHALHLEAAQNAGCAAASHPAIARIARWLLTAQDCTGSSVIRISQEDIARHLAVRRTTVTAGAAALKASGACSYLRERIVIERRDLLMTYACDCYADLPARWPTRVASSRLGPEL